MEAGNLALLIFHMRNNGAVKLCDLITQKAPWLGENDCNR